MTQHPRGEMDEIPERESIIPKWADEKAGRVIEMFSKGDNAYIDRALLHGAFAAALVQERERCAKAAFDFIVLGMDLEGCDDIAKNVAAAIRKAPAP